MRRQRIAHLIASNFFGGPEKQILEHARRLNGGPFEFRLITFLEDGTNELLERAVSEGFAAALLQKRPPFDPRSIGELTALLRRDGIDLLVTHHYKANVIGRLAALRTGIPTVAVSRGWTGENRKIRFYEWLDRRFLHFADHIVAVSEGQRSKVLSLGVPPRLVSVIHNCIDVQESQPPSEVSLRRELGLAAEALLIVSAGRLSPEKNIEGLIRVAARVTAQIPQSVFIVFGEGVLRASLEDSIRESGLKGRFLLPGFRQDFTALLPQIEIFVLPSFTEGLPNVVLEAFAARRPVVATAVGGTPEVVVEGEGGFLVHPAEEEKMSARIVELLRRPELRSEMGERGYQRICTHFSPLRQTEAYLELYREVARNNAERIRNRFFPVWKS
jgi:glycosyltransferase involved in cell wall biosynthesis